MPMHEDEVVERMMWLGPFEDARHAQRLLGATLHALRDFLLEDEVEWLSADLGPLPPRNEHLHVEQPSVEGFYRHVALYAGARRGLAEEQARIACRALAESLPRPTLRRLQQHLEPLAPLFEIPEPASEAALAPARLVPEAGADQTLAGGRPGASRPLHAAAPPEREGESAASPQQRHAREHRTLATAHPSSQRPAK